jgi:hypothetical protein
MRDCSWDDEGKTFCSGEVSRLWNIHLCGFHKDGLRYLFRQYHKFRMNNDAKPVQLELF